MYKKEYGKRGATSAHSSGGAGLDGGTAFSFCWYLALYASIAGLLARIFVIKSAFVDLVVVGIFAREQISLRSATLRDLLWESQRRGRGEGEDVQFCIHWIGRKGRGRALHVTRGCARKRKWQDWIGSSSSRHGQGGNGPIMEDGINQLFHPAYPLPPQHQPFPDSHDVVQGQYHRMFSTSSQPLTHNPHSTAPHIYGFYNRPPPSTNDHPPSATPSSPPRNNEPQSPFSQDPTPPSHTPQPEPPIDDEPLYVNAKQYYRILKRRIARARLEEVHRLSQKRKVPTHIHLRNVEPPLTCKLTLFRIAISP